MIKRLIARLRARKQRRAIMQAVNDATARGSCVILGETPYGTRVIVCGRDQLTRSMETIAQDNNVVW